MARHKEKNIVERLAEAGEEAIQRIGNAAAADKVLGRARPLPKIASTTCSGACVALEKLEKRLGAIEKRLDKLEGKGSSGSRKTSSAKRSTAPRKSSSSSRAAAAKRGVPFGR